MNALDEDVVDYCRACSDAQLAEVLRKEWRAHEHRDYASVRVVAAERGWTVNKGERVV